MNAAELTGRASTHIADVAMPPCRLHAHAVRPFENLREAALSEGIDLTPVSSFRDFERQLGIWNAKFNGTRPLLDAAGTVLDAAALSADERIDAILLWSALPGASRHHWGTDVDLIDRNAADPDYRPALIAAEFAPGGAFAALGRWLETHATRFGFFRPFRGERSGVQPEPWHVSFAPVAEKARRLLDPGLLGEALLRAPLAGKERVLARLEELHARYVRTIDWP